MKEVVCFANWENRKLEVPKIKKNHRSRWVGGMNNWNRNMMSERASLAKWLQEVRELPTEASEWRENVRSQVPDLVHLSYCSKLPQAEWLEQKVIICYSCGELVDAQVLGSRRVWLGGSKWFVMEAFSFKEGGWVVDGDFSSLCKSPSPLWRFYPQGFIISQRPKAWIRFPTNWGKRHNHLLCSKSQVDHLGESWNSQIAT